MLQFCDLRGRAESAPLLVFPFAAPLDPFLQVRSSGNVLDTKHGSVTFPQRQRFQLSTGLVSTVIKG